MKTVFITGISRGIGKALADKFLDEGWFVLGTIRESTYKTENENLKVFELDLLDEESIQRCANEILDFGEKIDIFINNAGTLVDKNEARVVSRKLRETLDVNLIGLIDLTERLIPLLKTSGHIINISSTAGSLELVGTSSHYPNHYPAYKISKCALNMYTRILARRPDILERDIIVSSLHPGWVKTEMGGENAGLSPEEAANNVYLFAIDQVPTGGFWHKGKRLPW